MRTNHVLIVVLHAVVLTTSAGLVHGEVDESAGAHSGRKQAGKNTFERETFGGNGRACSTCHTGDSGTINPEQARELFNRDPRNPLFRSIDSDDGIGTSYT